MMLIYRIKFMFLFSYCSCLFAMKPYEIVRKSELEKSPVNEIKKYDLHNEGSNVPDAIKAKIEVSKKKDTPSNEHDLDSGTIQKQEEPNISDSFNAKTPQASHSISLDIPSDEHALDSGTIQKQEQLNNADSFNTKTPQASHSISLDIPSDEHALAAGIIQQQQQINSSDSFNTKTPQASHSITLDITSQDTAPITSIQNYGGAESEILQLGKEIVQSKYEDLIKNAIKSSGNSHDINELLEREIEHAAHHFLNIKAPALRQKLFENFEYEIKNLADKIKKYNNIQVYTQLDLMVDFLQEMNLFLEQSHFVNLSNTMVKNIEKAYITGVITCNNFKTQPMTYDFTTVPESVRTMYASCIKKCQNLPFITDSRTMMQTIYEADGSIQEIIQTLKNSLASNSKNQLTDRYYIEFIAFALIFKNTIAATTCVVNEISKRYQIIEPLKIYGIY